MEDPVCGGASDEIQTLADILESDEVVDDFSSDDAMTLVQNYINRNKIIEAIIIDSIAFNDVQKHFKKTIKTTNAAGDKYKYVEHSSEFWPYRLVQVVSKLPKSYKKSFMTKYSISEEKLTSVLDALGKVNNQKIYKYLYKTLDELKAVYV
jgi:hypothetical protein